MILCYSVPIDSYYGDAVYFKKIFLNSDKCPSLSQFNEFLKERHQEEVQMSENNPEWGPFLFEYQQCLDALSSIKEDDFPNLYVGIVTSSFFIEHKKWGRQPIEVAVIKPFEVKFDSQPQ